MPVRNIIEQSIYPISKVRLHSVEIKWEMVIKLITYYKFTNKTHNLIKQMFSVRFYIYTNMN